LAVVTAGAGTALAAALKTIEISKTIYDMKSSADKAKASAAFTNSVVKGYQSGIDIRNVLNPVPQLTEVEKQLLAKASGETKSPTETNVVVDGAPAAAAGGGIPWLLIAGAAAAALLS
jgi:mevalonate kinase